MYPGCQSGVLNLAIALQEKKSSQLSVVREQGRGNREQGTGNREQGTTENLRSHSMRNYHYTRELDNTITLQDDLTAPIDRQEG
ncbi:hypothetical protein IQ231_16900 [Cuspidothrix issatschenkoi LEGE 03284]|uniref:hypothetical protein n=1 Tax=Cuspidothrix issatschenkoi TaxID=230752 RepID=UPI001882E809|nr:hypothetical protein [Cuspidothrix issatschenkoi]MBE9233302.1 hypothetical protein [Cuspidothrix issatschenkoi LEGE 03284]